MVEMKNVEIVNYLVENKTRVKNILTRYAVSMKNKWDNDECTLVFSVKNKDWDRIKAIDNLWDKVEKFVKED